MAAIKSKDTAIEMQVRRALHAAGFRFRLHRKDLPGKPDIVLPRYRVAIFVDGCFWHGHECIEGHTPKSNTDYWGPKIRRNAERDRINRLVLTADGWQVEALHECTIVHDTAGLVSMLTSRRQPSNARA